MPKPPNPSPRKPSSRSQLKERQPTLILPDEPLDHSASASNTGGGDGQQQGQLGWADLQALAEDYDLEAAHHLRLLASSLQTRLSALSRHWDDVVSSLDARVRDLALGRFVDEFGADPERALEGVVREGMRPVEMGEGERGARKRKRVPPLSSRNGDDDFDPFAAPSGTASNKKFRASSVVLASAQKTSFSKAQQKAKKKVSAVPGSARSIRTGGAVGSPTSTRKPSSGRLRIRPSHNPLSFSVGPSTSSTSAGGAGNFIYNASSSSAAAAAARASMSVLPTPSLSRTAHPVARAPPATVRRPKRGESIVLKSLNGSPLGEFVASDDDESSSSSEREDLIAEGDEDEDNAEEEEEAEGSEEWDLMSRHEASRSEAGAFSKANRSPSKGKLTKKVPPVPALPRSASASTSTTAAPSISAFDPSLPSHAPSFAALKADFVRKMREELESEMMRELGIGAEERRRVEEIVGRSLRGITE
ncbi:hypothetical protein JCM6882_002743 [Rhodosporidiobolus microsporus]